MRAISLHSLSSLSTSKVTHGGPSSCDKCIQSYLNFAGKLPSKRAASCVSTLGFFYHSHMIYEVYDLSGSVYQVSPLYSASLIKKMNLILDLCPPDSSLPGEVVNAVNYLPSC